MNASTVFSRPNPPTSFIKLYSHEFPILLSVPFARTITLGARCSLRVAAVNSENPTKFMNCVFARPRRMQSFSLKSLECSILQLTLTVIAVCCAVLLLRRTMCRLEWDYDVMGVKATLGLGPRLPTTNSNVPFKDARSLSSPPKDHLPAVMGLGCYGVGCIVYGLRQRSDRLC